jgi:glucose-6-phosphate 1-epimerase
MTTFPERHPLIATDLPDSVTVVPGRGGLPMLRVNGAAGVAEIYLQGAHVTSWHPHGQAPVLWMSESSRYAPGTPFRGGIPLCFPWFGVNPAGPQHGLARITDWILAAASEDGDAVVLTFVLADDSGARFSSWPHAFEARYEVRVGAALDISLSVTNSSADPIEYEEALHTYFAVSDVRAVAIGGLGRLPYTDATGSGVEDDAPLRLSAAITRTYSGATDPTVLSDPGCGRSIEVDRTNAASTIVWNPWSGQAATMPDFGDDEWPDMVCVETGNTGEARIRLEPGGTSTFTTSIRVASSARSS